MIFFWDLSADAMVYPDPATGQPCTITVDEMRESGWRIDALAELRMRRELPRFTRGGLRR
jgi:hypothetical protein